MPRGPSGGAGEPPTVAARVAPLVASTGKSAILPDFTPVYNLPMHDIPNRIADVLLEVEAILRTSGKWDPFQPPAGALLSLEPFCIDTLSFEQWLQWIFLPRMKQILEFKKPLPAKSGIFAYAQEQLRKEDPPAGKLLLLIKRFDDLITIQSSARMH
jgi:uncharacterized protein YqcC (DUF446 family)